MDDGARALAFVAKRQGSRDMPAAAWAHVLSLELGWMSPGQAKAFVARAEAAGHLVAGDALRLAVDPDTVDIPRGFRPEPDAVMEGPDQGDPFLEWVNRLAKQSSRSDVLAAIATRQETHLLDAMSAVLMLAQEAGLDVTAAARDALRIMQTESG